MPTVNAEMKPCIIEYMKQTEVPSSLDFVVFSKMRSVNYAQMGWNRRNKWPHHHS